MTTLPSEADYLNYSRPEISNQMLKLLLWSIPNKNKKKEPSGQRVAAMVDACKVEGAVDY